MRFGNLKLVTCFLIVCFGSLKAQDTPQARWNNHACAVALTYDDGLNVHLDKVIPAMDSLGINGTFYIPGNAATLNSRAEDWRKAASSGHELGNHTLFHPCSGSPAGREWLNPDYDLDHYTLTRIMDEIRVANTLLKAIDGKDTRTFAYTCGDRYAGTTSFYDQIKTEFIAARGVMSGYESMDNSDLYDMKAFMVSGQSGEALIDMVKKAMETKTLIVFLFHGVGGEHSIDVALSEHQKLLDFLKTNEKEIWVAPLVDIATFMKQ